MCRIHRECSCFFSFLLPLLLGIWGLFNYKIRHLTPNFHSIRLKIMYCINFQWEFREWPQISLVTIFLQLVLSTSVSSYIFLHKLCSSLAATSGSVVCVLWRACRDCCREVECSLMWSLGCKVIFSSLLLFVWSNAVLIFPNGLKKIFYQEFV